MKVYLISGKAGSGKNEVAKLIKEEVDNVVITGFAKYIKQFALEVTDWDGQDDDKPRQFLQEMGDILRGIDINFLTKRMLDDIKAYKVLGIENVVICDVRLKTELDYFCKNCKDDVVKIRVNSKISKRVLSESEQEHITEIELDNYDGFDYVIDNAFDSSLRDKVKEIVEGR